MERLKACSCADRTLYAVHPIPLSEVKAIRKHAPSFGTQHVVLVLSNGLTLPPLYFTSGGVKGLFSALREVCCPEGFPTHVTGSGPDL